MIEIKAPDNTEIRKNKMGQTVIFIAGGITDCPNWQKEFVNEFKKYEDNLILFNPRDSDFDVTIENRASQQVEWEFERLDKSDIVIFWFPKETLCPITLYELGRATLNQRRIYVGIHPEYKRKFDVEKQLSLARPEVKPVYSIEDLANQVKEYLDMY